MYNPIALSFPEGDPMSKFKLNIFEGNTTFVEKVEQLYTEAVFINGKQTLEPIITRIAAVKEELLREIKEQDDSIEALKAWTRIPAGEPRGPKPKRKNFDPVHFWKHMVWKDLEDVICEVFGFRSVQIMPYIERYNSSDKQFESYEINAFVYDYNRYPIESLVTDKGLYDNSHSTVLDMRISLGFIKSFEPDVILGCFLHEIGHCIDPALVDIRFLETNVLSKYITDRKGKINSNEAEVEKRGFLPILCIVLIPGLQPLWKWLKETIQRLFMGKKRYDEYRQKKLLDSIREALAYDTRQFNRQSYTEAFADNFARMYGYGPQIAQELNKIDSDIDHIINSRIKKEDERREYITEMTIDTINDVHKTDIHRIKSLIREYDKDIKDPNIPAEVKKQLKADKEELEKVLYEYTHNRSAFYNRVNKLIADEIDRIDRRESAKASQEAIQESTIFSESKKNKEPLSTKERAVVKKKFPDAACSFARDKDGYFCYTHRARSKSYPSINDIPKKDVDFVSSTS